MALVFAAPPPVTLPVAGAADRFPVRRVFCVGRNYADHVREMGSDPSRDLPCYFAKPADALTPVDPAAGLDLAYPSVTNNLHYEAELVVAIGRGGRDIPLAEAPDHIWGHAVGLDMTRRDLQFAMRDKGQPWEIGKAFDCSAPIGPIRPVSAGADMAAAAIWLTVNGARKQDASTASLIWSVPEIIADLSRYFALAPGDVIFTGTPAGVGPVVPGDVMEAGIEGLGSIVVRVTAA